MISTIAAEALILQEGLENAVCLKNLIADLLPKQDNTLPIRVIVDNKIVSEAINSTRLADDKRLRLDAATIKESERNNEITAINLVPEKEQLANCSTKRGAKRFVECGFVIKQSLLFCTKS